MSLLSSPHPSLFCIKNPNNKTNFLTFSSLTPQYAKVTKMPSPSYSFVRFSSSSSNNPTSGGGGGGGNDDSIIKNLSKNISKNLKDDVSRIKNLAEDIAEDIEDEWGEKSQAQPNTYVDEWGEKSRPDPEPATRFPDPRGEDDEWGDAANGSPSADVAVGSQENEKLMELKRCLVDTVYGTDFGFRASSDVRAETLELVAQLEAANPTPAPTEATELLDGNWVLVYTAFSELLPLLAAGSIPLVKVEKITQRIDVTNLTIENSTTLSGPVATFSFSASANFEVRTPCRIQVEFKEGTFKPPEVKSNIDLPENVDIFGRKISLSPVQQSLNPLQNAVAGIARTISGQPPLKVPIPGERTKSWLLITYLDKDLRISRGDGGLFVLVKEGSPLLYQ